MVQPVPKYIQLRNLLFIVIAFQKIVPVMKYHSSNFSCNAYSTWNPVLCAGDAGLHETDKGLTHVGRTFQQGETGNKNTGVIKAMLSAPLREMKRKMGKWGHMSALERPPLTRVPYNLYPQNCPGHIENYTSFKAKYNPGCKALWLR